MYTDTTVVIHIFREHVKSYSIITVNTYNTQNKSVRLQDKNYYYITPM